MNYYTLQIVYGSTMDPKKTEFKDLQPKEGQDVQTWANEIRAKLYTTGFNLTTAPGTIKFIHPLLIIEAYLIKQDKKFAP